METNVNYTIVGTFVIILTAAIIVSIIWLSSGFSFEQYVTYQIFMKEAVTGLNAESPVEYNGVNVGSVTKVELNHKNPQLVEVLLSIKKGTPITRGTVAMLSSRGITGITYIALQDKSADLRPLVAEPGQPYPVIKTAPSIFMRIDTALSEFAKNFREISQSFQTLLDKENQQSFKDILFNLKDITQNLADNNNKLTVILDNTSKASQQFTPLIQTSTNAMRMLENQTLPAFYQALSNLDDVARTLNEVSEELKQNPSMLIRGVDRQASLGPGERK